MFFNLGVASSQWQRQMQVYRLEFTTKIYENIFHVILVGQATNILKRVGFLGYSSAQTVVFHIVCI